MVICQQIETQIVDDMFRTIKYKKTIPITYYNKEIIKNDKIIKKCINCNRNGIYNNNDISYCWIHVQDC